MVKPIPDLLLLNQNWELTEFVHASANTWDHSGQDAPPLCLEVKVILICSHLDNKCSGYWVILRLVTDSTSISVRDMEMSPLTHAVLERHWVWMRNRLGNNQGAQTGLRFQPWALTRYSFSSLSQMNRKFTIVLANVNYSFTEHYVKTQIYAYRKSSFNVRNEIIPLA